MPTKEEKEAPPAPVAWDSCVFIHRIQQTPAHIGDLRQITDAAENGKIIIYASAFALAEVAKPGGGKLPLTKAQIKKLHEFFENDYIELVAVERFVGEYAAEIVRDFSIKPPDAVHVASAILADVPVLHTYDGPLLAKDNKIGKPGKPKLRITEPVVPGGQGSIFATQS